MVTALAALVGCETTVETSDGRPMPPPPRAAPDTPDGSPINAIALVFGPKPLDTNGNLRPDTIQIEAYLFSRPYPSPMHRDGSFEVEIYRVGGMGRAGEKPLRRWVIPPERLAAMRSRSLIGPSHSIGVSLLDNGGNDEIAEQSVDLIAYFTPSDGGERIMSMGVRTVSMATPIVEPGR
jgi:hypothetical protein